MKFHVIYGLCWLFYFIGWFVIYKKQLADKSKGLVFAFFLVAGLLFPAAAVYLTHDIAVVSFLKDKYRSETMVDVRETVEFPGSVYWEDNVFPGFDPLSRRWMIEHYLDGFHLQTLVLNGDDGKYYLYRAKADRFEKSKRLQDQINNLEKQAASSIEAGKAAQDDEEKSALIAKGNRLRKQAGELVSKRQVVHDKAVLAIITKEEVFSRPEDLPPVNYKVVLNKEPLPIWQQRYIYSDKIQIIDQIKGEVIAWSRRVERYKYFLEADFRGGQLLFGNVAGEGYALGFVDKNVFAYLDSPKASLNRNYLRKRTYIRNLRGLYNGR